ncbi:MAG: CDP-alcohol phosphatidyltransferase family protein [Woeseia sp.]
MSKIRYTVPNSFTALSLLLGLGSIVTGHLGELEMAAWMIVWCGLLDVMDGLTARLLKATSSFGAEFDSMADLVAFGVAPGMLVLETGMRLGGIAPDTGWFQVLLASVGIFVLAGAMRLARFNLSSQKPVKGWFSGVPITAAGGGLTATAVILLSRYDGIAGSLPLHVYLPLLMVALALLMVSTLRFPKIVKRKSKVINSFQAFNIIASFYCGVTRSFPEFLFSMSVFLLVSGLIAGRLTRRSGQYGEHGAGDASKA